MRLFLYGFLFLASLNVRAEKYGGLFEEAFAPDVPFFVQIPLDEIDIDVPSNYAAILTDTTQSGYIKGVDAYYYPNTSCGADGGGGNISPMTFQFTANRPFYVNPAAIFEFAGGIRTDIQSILLFPLAAAGSGSSGQYVNFSSCTHPVIAQGCCYEVAYQSGIGYTGTNVGNFTYP